MVQKYFRYVAYILVFFVFCFLLAYLLWYPKHLFNFLSNNFGFQPSITAAGETAYQSKKPYSIKSVDDTGSIVTKTPLECKNQFPKNELLLFALDNSRIYVESINVGAGKDKLDSSAMQNNLFRVKEVFDGNNILVTKSGKTFLVKLQGIESPVYSSFGVNNKDFKKIADYAKTNLQEILRRQGMMVFLELDRKTINNHNDLKIISNNKNLKNSKEKKENININSNKKTEDARRKKTETKFTTKLQAYIFSSSFYDIQMSMIINGNALNASNSNNKYFTCYQASENYAKYNNLGVWSENKIDYPYYIHNNYKTFLGGFRVVSGKIDTVRIENSKLFIILSNDVLISIDPEFVKHFDIFELKKYIGKRFEFRGYVVSASRIGGAIMKIKHPNAIVKIDD